jgi:hypothetical protein
MRPFRIGIISTALAAAAVGCDPTGPSLSARLSTDQEAYAYVEGGTPVMATVQIVNYGGQEVSFIACDVPGLPYDVAPVILQRQDVEGGWNNVEGSGYCPTPEQYLHTVEVFESAFAARILPGVETGRYRFVLWYRAGAEQGMAISNEFTTTVSAE